MEANCEKTGAPKPFSREAVFSAVGVAAIVVYWLVYFWQDNLSGMGDYRYFPYGFHELWSAAMVAVLPVTLIWLASLLYRTVKGRLWKQKAILLALLAVLAAGQIGYFYQLSNRVSTTAFLATVEEVVDQYHVVIQDSGHRVVLETNPMVTALMKADGTEYILYYDWSRNDPDRGRLRAVLSYAED